MVFQTLLKVVWSLRNPAAHSERTRSDGLWSSELLKDFYGPRGTPKSVCDIREQDPSRKIDFLFVRCTCLSWPSGYNIMSVVLYLPNAASL